MRSPKQREVKEYCKVCIPKILEKYQLGKVEKIVLDDEGWVNPCFFVNDSYVVRFNARDPDLPKYEREKWSFDILKDSSVPVPGRVILDNDKDICRYNFLITEKIDGHNLEKNWSNLKTDQMNTLATEAGRLLNQIHNKEIEFFGELANKGPYSKFENGFDFLKQKLELHIIQAKYNKIFDEKISNFAIGILNSKKDELLEVNRPKLIHMDFHFGNLLYKENRIVGVVDFEWAIAGDPLYDLVFWKNGEGIYKDAQPHFLEGYGKSSFSPREYSLMDLYQMIKNIELSIIAKVHFPDDEANEYKEITINHMKAIV